MCVWNGLVMLMYVNALFQALNGRVTYIFHGKDIKMVSVSILSLLLPNYIHSQPQVGYINHSSIRLLGSISISPFFLLHKV